MPTPDTLPVWLTIAQVAEIGQCSKDKIRSMIARKELTAHHFGRSVRIKLSDLENCFAPIEVA
jgi:excisionase family DNA binding protein